MMQIREATAKDLDPILSLFENTIKKINSRDYSQEQIEVWTASKNKETWLSKISEQSFYVAFAKNQLIGFSSIDTDGYIDFMYVHHEFQHQGIAKALLLKLQEAASENNIQRVWASVSITAQPFFSRNGFYKYDDEHKSVEDVHFKNALMEKSLD